ncbi:hypothetical protein GPECTOR_89g482 [Gonium pectorale]|uniref:RRM domain-containing protein n=1 Tax=Gonium pectorale TaxID=33097 RepID=A0A150G0T6_GONPE|nr:hypothetical protein GPECTOR_89g482 [Gonium pectorale]|eukprot:KXZ43462.1 hypothetical protein GPECTOR_89g482 [Gonium pectorale]
MDSPNPVGSDGPNKKSRLLDMIHLPESLDDAVLDAVLQPAGAGPSHQPQPLPTDEAQLQLGTLQLGSCDDPASPRAAAVTSASDAGDGDGAAAADAGPDAAAAGAGPVTADGADGGDREMAESGAPDTGDVAAAAEPQGAGVVAAPAFLREASVDPALSDPGACVSVDLPGGSSAYELEAMGGDEGEGEVASLRANGTAAGGRSAGVEVFVGGLGPDAREEEVRAALTELGGGEVLSVRLQMTRGTSICKGYGFVTFAEEAAAQRAIGAATPSAPPADAVDAASWWPVRIGGRPVGLHASRRPFRAVLPDAQAAGAARPLQPHSDPGASINALLAALRAHPDKRAAVAAALQVVQRGAKRAYSAAPSAAAGPGGPGGDGAAAPPGLKPGSSKAAKTPLMVLHEYATKMQYELSFLETAEGPAGPYSVEVRLASGGSNPSTIATAVGKARTKKDAKQVSAAACLEKMMEGPRGLSPADLLPAPKQPVGAAARGPGGKAGPGTDRAGSRGEAGNASRRQAPGRPGPGGPGGPFREPPPPRDMYRDPHRPPMDRMDAYRDPSFWEPFREPYREPLRDPYRDSYREPPPPYREPPPPYREPPPPYREPPLSHRELPPPPPPYGWGPASPGLPPHLAHGSAVGSGRDGPRGGGGGGGPLGAVGRGQFSGGSGSSGSARDGAGYSVVQPGLAPSGSSSHGGGGGGARSSAGADRAGAGGGGGSMVQVGLQRGAAAGGGGGAAQQGGTYSSLYGRDGAAGQGGGLDSYPGGGSSSFDGATGQKRNYSTAMQSQAGFGQSQAAYGTPASSQGLLPVGAGGGGQDAFGGGLLGGGGLRQQQPGASQAAGGAFGQPSGMAPMQAAGYGAGASVQSLFGGQHLQQQQQQQQTAAAAAMGAPGQGLLGLHQSQQQQHAGGGGALYGLAGQPVQLQPAQPQPLFPSPGFGSQAPSAAVSLQPQPQQQQQLQQGLGAYGAAAAAMQSGNGLFGAGAVGGLPGGSGVGGFAHLQPQPGGASLYGGAGVAQQSQSQQQQQQQAFGLQGAAGAGGLQAFGGIRPGGGIWG